MKKLMLLAGITTIAVSVFAQEAVKADEPKVAREEGARETTVWPAWLALCNYPQAADVVGLRLTIPFSTRQENVTGFDLGLWGHSMYFEGLQVNVLRNDVKDDFSGIQVGVYNTAGNADLFALQFGLWNEAQSICGVQAGIVNLCGEGQGFQVGLINRAETLGGYQIGLVNVIRDAELRFCPLINVGF